MYFLKNSIHFYFANLSLNLKGDIATYFFIRLMLEDVTFRYKNRITVLNKYHN